VELLNQTIYEYAWSNEYTPMTS